MKNERVELGDVFYVFTNWGICKGRVVKIIDELEYTGFANGPVGIIQHKLNIDIDDNNMDMKYGFFYRRHQLFDRAIDALSYEAERWGWKEVIK